MKINDVVVAESYAVDLNETQGNQQLLDHTLPPPEDDDEGVLLGRSRRALRWSEIVGAARDYGVYLETDQLPSGSGWATQLGSWIDNGPQPVLACGTVLDVRQRCGRTQLGVTVRVPIFDWWPWHRWYWSQPRYSRELDAPIEVLQEVWMQAQHATFVVNARALVVAWSELATWRFRNAIEWREQHPDWREKRDQILRREVDES